MFVRIVIKFIEYYQQTIGQTVSCCRFYPSCSEFTKQAIKKYGIVLGGMKGVWRVIRCSPFFSRGGYDPA